MKPIACLGEQDISRIKGILFDIDDTFTLEGKIPSQAYNALWELHDAGILLIPITGRPAGWCDHIARMWPVNGIVGENGAFYYYYCSEECRLKRRYIFDPHEAVEKKELLDNIKEQVLRRVPGARIAADQHFRLFDLAIDFAEDMPCLSREEIRDICNVFEQNQAVYKVSSIHVNGWFGDYNKLTTTKLFLDEIFGFSWEEAKRSFLFIGDSPNDEPMFEAFPLTVGVANVSVFADMMDFLPTYITTRDGGLGFAEMANIIVTNRM